MAPLDGAGSDGWRLTGDGVDSAAIFDAALTRYAGAVDGAIYDYYPPESVFGEFDTRQKIFDNYLAHAAQHASGAHLDVKRSIYVESGWAGSAPHGAYIATQIALPGWLRYKDRPVVGVYDTTEWATNNLAGWTAFKAELPGNTYFIALGNNTPSHHTTLGVSAWASYGPNGAGLGAAGQYTWAQQQAVDQSHWGSTSGREVLISMTIGGDQRPRRANPNGSTTAYADPATLAQWISEQQQIGPMFPKVIYAGSEMTEGTYSLWGSAQRPSTYTDGLRWAKYPSGHLNRPTAYVDKIDTHTLNFTRSGSPVWSRNESGGAAIVGAFDSDLMYVTEGPDTLTSVGFPAVTRIRVMGARGGASGSCTFSVDEGAVTTVDTNSGSGQQQELFDSGALTEGVHSIVIGGHFSNPGLSRRCAADNVEITQNVRALP